MDDLNNASRTDTTSHTANGETIETTHTETIETTKVGFFQRLVEKMQENPIKTSLGITAATAVSIAGGMNYRNHGSVLPGASSSDLAEAAGAVATFLR